MAQSGMRNVGRRRCRGEKMQMAAVDAVASLPLRLPSPSPLLKLMLCQQARTSYDAAYLLLLLLPAPVEVFHAAA